ncbi:MAG: glycosyltransferase family 4 protein [Actinomycetota bacterium]
MTEHLLVTGVAALATFLATPIYRRFALRFGAVDIPEDRKIHRDPTPTSGGVALFVGVGAGFVVSMFLGRFQEMFKGSDPFAVIAAGFFLVMVGFLDDVRGMRAPTKLAAQLVAAGALVLAGVQFFYFWLPKIGVVSLSPDLAAALTVVWTIMVINGVNLIDGLDGLAAGVTAIAAGALFVYAFKAQHGQSSVATLFPALVFGSCLGFLPHNVNPAKIFMGDSGSMLLGLLLASSTVSGVGRTVEPRLSDVTGLIIPVLLPLFVLAIPLADVGFAILRRAKAGTPVFYADKNHIHHWLLDMAQSHRRAVLVMWSWSAMLASAAMVLSIGHGKAPYIVAISIAAMLVLSIVFIPRVLRRSGMRVAGVPAPLHNPKPSTEE